MLGYAIAPSTMYDVRSEDDTLEGFMIAEGNPFVMDPGVRHARSHVQCQSSTPPTATRARARRSMPSGGAHAKRLLELPPRAAEPHDADELWRRVVHEG